MPYMSGSLNRNGELYIYDFFQTGIFFSLNLVLGSFEKNIRSQKSARAVQSSSLWAWVPSLKWRALWLLTPRKSNASWAACQAICVPAGLAQSSLRPSVDNTALGIIAALRVFASKGRRASSLIGWGWTLEPKLLKFLCHQYGNAAQMRPTVSHFSGSWLIPSLPPKNLRPILRPSGPANGTGILNRPG